MATPDPAPAAQAEEQAVYPVFQRELLKALVDALHKQNHILTDLKTTLFDLKDELAFAREERKAAR